MTSEQVPDALTAPGAAYERVAEFKVGYGTVTTSRMPVPGGWLYTTSSVTAYGASVHSVFVPAEPEPLRQEPVVNYEDRH